MYELKDEKPLLYKMFYSFDGNDSLKRAVRRAQSDDVDESMGPINERPSIRKVQGDRYLLQEYVDKWANATTKELLGDPGDVVNYFNFKQLLIFC